MKILTFQLIAIALILAGCGATTSDGNGELPSDLDELKALRTEVKQDLDETAKRLDTIDARIEKLQPSRQRQARLVTTEEVMRSDFNKYARIQGSVESKDLVSVSAESPGRITSVRVEEGDPVNKGELIATIDMESLKKQRQELETQLSLARDIFERQKRLWDQNIGSEVQYLRAKNDVDRLEQSIETIDYNLSKSKIFAPLTGIVDLVNLKAGEMAQPGAPIVMVLDTRNLKVVADVPESYLGKVKRGERVDVNFPALDENLEEPVTLIGRKIDPTNRTFKVEVDIRGTDVIKPNLLAEVSINDYVEEDVIVISQELVQEEVGGRKFVMVVDETDDGPVAKKTYVQTGQSYEGDVVISSGLEEGQTIILSGSRGISNGEPVRLQSNQIASDGE